MKNIIAILMLGFCYLSCNVEAPTHFPKEALEEIMTDVNEKKTTFKDVLEKNKGKKIFIDVWATWCRDCIVGLPKLKKLKEKHPDFVYVYVSLDKNIKSWKKGIKKYSLEGQHYYIEAGWKSGFSKAIDLDWIPRYMIINEDSSIRLFKAIKTNDKALLEAMK